MEGKIVEEKKKVLFHLFISTLYLSAFTFGGGYVIVSLLKKKFVDEYHWIENDEMLDLVAIAQSAPGAIAVNGAIVVGYKLAGIIDVYKRQFQIRLHNMAQVCTFLTYPCYGCLLYTSNMVIKKIFSFEN